jgi:hypothetical protein
MSRNLKALGLVLTAVFTMGAAGASAAFAEDAFTSEKENTVVTADGTDNIFKFTNPQVEFHCENTRFSGTLTGKSAKSLAIFPTYFGNKANPNSPECESALGAIKVEPNGCSYVLTGATTGKDGTGTDATVSLVCPPGKAIQVTAPIGCTFSIPPQTSTEGGVTYTNGVEGGKSDVTVHLTMTGITYTTTFTCQLAGLPSEADNIDYTGTITANGYEDTCKAGECPINGDEFKEGAKVGIEVS